MKIQRNTVQRQIILDTLQRLDTHPSVDELCVEIHSKHPTISKTTVYRNLRQLTEQGEIRQLTLSDDIVRYDRATKPHYHFKCRDCGSTLDVDIEQLENINSIVQEKYGFQVDEHDIVFRGLCKKCGGVRKIL